MTLIKRLSDMNDVDPISAKCEYEMLLLFYNHYLT